MQTTLALDDAFAPAPSRPKHLLNTVLVVDDSRAQRRVLSSLLLGWGYQVIEAASGAEALEVCAGQEIELIISDWLMPGMTGPEFCQAFREANPDRYSYFLLITSKNEKKDVAVGLEMGADDFLSKPVNSAELRARLLAGERIVNMQRELRSKNALLFQTLTELREAQAALDRDMEEARRFQQSLLSERMRHYNGASVSLFLRACGHVGGDLVGAFRVNETRVGLFALDVSGHGVASALVAARIAGLLNGASPEQNIAMTIDELGLYTMRPPAEVCAMLNELMLSEIDTDLYLTMVLADCDLRTGRIEMVQAGHPSPLIQRADGSVEQIGDGGLPIGLFSGAAYETVETHLAFGDRFLVFSDGPVEAASPAGTQLGVVGWSTIVREHSDHTGIGLLDALYDRLAAFTGSHDPKDDVSMALLERVPQVNDPG